MTMKYKVIFADLAKSKAEAESIALFAAKNFHPEREKFEIEKTEALPNG